METVGPILYLHGVERDHLKLAALIAPPNGSPPPKVQASSGPAHKRRLASLSDGRSLYGYFFGLPMDTETGYRVGSSYYPVSTRVGGDLRLAYVSCNGQEHGDRQRDPAERNALWRRLARDHQARPLQLLLHGGDQLYADEMLQVHPSVQRWAASHRPDPNDDDDDPEILRALRRHLFRRYLELYAQPEIAWLMARVPSLAMWDDHDICDGWGSLPDWKLDSAVGRAVFQAAREAFLIFQHGTTGDVLPALFSDPDGRNLTWRLELPGLRLIAPDLRSERRRHRVMGRAGWEAFETALAGAGPGKTFVLSSVPAMGPRLSWVERLLMLVPHMQKYEDDLRDQWQSRAHRSEWRRFLLALLSAHTAENPLTVLSGEIHLATRGSMAAEPCPVQQLVSSGIAHPPPPRGYAKALGALASLGEAPLPAHPIRLQPLPGTRDIYTNQRNYLVLARSEAGWQAYWELEQAGPTPALDLCAPRPARCPV